MNARPSRGLARVLSKLGAASRTTAAEWIRAGRVAIDGRVENNPDVEVPDSANITVDGKALSAEPKLYYMLNKPKGLITTTRDERGRATVYECIPPNLRDKLAPVGRLDKASEGLLLFTNDTQWSAMILAPEHHLPKIYHVQIDQQPTAEQLQSMQRGRQCEEDWLAVQTVSVLRQGEKNAWLEITLTEGKNRHIRRLLAAFDIECLRLIRIGIGPLRLNTLAKGQCRLLSEEEIRLAANAN